MIDGGAKIVTIAWQNLFSLASVGDTHTHTDLHIWRQFVINLSLWQLTISQLAAVALLPSQRAEQASKKGGEGGGGGGKQREQLRVWKTWQVEAAAARAEESFGRELNKFPLPFPIFHLCHFCHFCNSSFVFEPKVVCIREGEGGEGGVSSREGAQTFWGAEASQAQPHPHLPRQRVRKYLKLHKVALACLCSKRFQLKLCQTH